MAEEADGGDVLSVASVDPEKAGQLPSLSREKKLLLARDFVNRMKRGQKEADKFIAKAVAISEENILPDGEMLLLQPVFPPHLVVDGIITGQARNGKILLSLRDFIDVLLFPIELDPEKEIAEGWYIRENKKFFLDFAQKYVKTDAGEFSISEDAFLEEGDIFIPASELGQWFDFELNTVVSSQELKIISDVPLPMQEKFKRRSREMVSRKALVPVQPRKEEPYKAYDSPMIDVSTNSTYRRQGTERQGERTHNASVITSGDLAYGTVTTQTQINNKDQIRNVRVNYKQESEDPELLGVLGARRFELGDVQTARPKLSGSSGQEFGVRLTNADPNRSFISPTTVISGTAFPDWDVELYRDEQLLSFQEVDENGYYQFDNVILYQTENNFRLVFYGPQGEIHEEAIHMPVDRKRLSDAVGAYDVSLTFDGEQFYRKKTNDEGDEDEGTPDFVAQYELPLTDNIGLLTGVRSFENNNTRHNVANAGISTTVAGALVNMDVALDDEGEEAAELVLRRRLGKHDFSNSTSWFAPNFDVDRGEDEEDMGNLRNSMNLSGPLPEIAGKRSRYAIGTNYAQNTEGVSNFSTQATLSTPWRNFVLNQQGTYEQSDLQEEDRVSYMSSLTGSFGRNRVRVIGDYQVEPETELQRVLLNYRRYFSKDIEFSLDVERKPQQSLTEYSAQLDWQAGFARISPSVSYNSDKEFFAGLNTRFGLLRDPQKRGYDIYDRTLSSNGGLSAFVYLDENGDGKFNEGEQPLEDVVVKGLQNGGQAETDENGVAILTRMREMKVTDIVIDPDSLADPVWIPGFEGVSILPRKGYVASIEFPVHNSGEIDGVLYARVQQQTKQPAPEPVEVVTPDAEIQDIPVTEKTEEESQDMIQEASAAPVELAPVPLRNVTINLYNAKGDVAQSVVTDTGGFYYFSRVPPGRYLMIIDEKSAAKGHFIRPMPQQIEIGYDGTVLYGNNIYVDSGEGDIPSEILANLDDYKARHPHIDFLEHDYDLVLNLGDYNSQLMMSLVWYKMRSRYMPILTGGDMMVEPSQSVADDKTGKYTLRIGLPNSSVDESYNRCRALMAREQYCKVEIYPSYMKEAKLNSSAL